MSFWLEMAVAHDRAWALRRPPMAPVARVLRVEQRSAPGIPSVSPCPICGGPVPPAAACHGRPRFFCSLRCLRARDVQRRRAQRRADRGER